MQGPLQKIVRIKDDNFFGMDENGNVIVNFLGARGVFDFHYSYCIFRIINSICKLE